MAPISGKIPVFKKKIASFLSKEDGKISKENLIKAGVTIAIFSIAASAGAKEAEAGRSCSPATCEGLSRPPSKNSHDKDYPPEHINSLDLSYSGGTATGTHNHCVQECHNNHASHASHASHGSHGSHCSGGVWRT